MFLLISAGHIGAPKRYTNMSSPYKALQRCVKRFGKLLRNYWPQRPETWTNCLYIESFITLHFLSFFHRRVSNLIFCCVTVKTIYTHLVAEVSSTQHYMSFISQGHPTKTLLIRWKHFLGYTEYFEIPIDTFYSKLRYKIVTYLFGHPRGTWVFSKLQGLQNYFPENFRCNLSFYECENFSDSYLNPFLNSKILGPP